MKKTHLIILLTALFGFAGFAFALPIYQQTQSMIPARDGVYDLGTTSPSNLRYNGYFNNLTVSGTCTGCGGGGSLSGGTAGMLTSWVNSTTVTATGTPTAASYFATSTTATSTFLGGFSAADSSGTGFRVLQSGKVRIGTDVDFLDYLGTASNPFNVTDNINDISGVNYVNRNNGGNAAICQDFANGRTLLNTPYYLNSYYASICFSGQAFNLFPGLPPNSLGITVPDGLLALIAPSINPASSTVVISSGPGYITGNYDQVFKTDSSGFPIMGLSTTSPFARLSIAHLPNDTKPIFAISTSTASATTTAFIIDRNGKVGIGTSSPTTLLDVDGVSTLGVENSLIPSLIVKGGSGGTDLFQLQRTSGAVSTYGLSLAGGGLAFKDVVNGFTVAGLYGDAGYNHLSFGVRNQTVTDTRADRISGKSYNSGTDVNGTEFQVYGSLGTGAGTPGDINFYTGTAGASSATTQTGTNRLTIKGNTGNVGISTSTPRGKLEVTGGTANNVNSVVLNPLTSGNRTLWIDGNSLNARLTNQNIVSTAAHILLQSDSGAGYVAIGTTSPTALLHIKGGTNKNFLFGTTASLIDNAHYIEYDYSETSNYGYIQARTANVAFRNFALNPFGGNLGIGTTTPTANFQATNQSSNATTSIQFGKANQNKGTCRTEYDTAGNPVYLYFAAGATSYTIQNGGVAPSGCQN